MRPANRIRCEAIIISCANGTTFHPLPATSAVLLSADIRIQHRAKKALDSIAVSVFVFIMVEFDKYDQNDVVRQASSKLI